MTDRPKTNGTWVVLTLVAMGVIAGIAGLIFRQLPEGRDGDPEGRPAATTRAVVPR